MFRFQACFYEANEQFRLDKQVDGFILQVPILFNFSYATVALACGSLKITLFFQILRQRVDRCMQYNKPTITPCNKVPFLLILNVNVWQIWHFYSIMALYSIMGFIIYGSNALCTIVFHHSP